MSSSEPPLVWLHGEIRTPPLSRKASIEAGYLLRVLQQGKTLGMPHSRPMPSSAKRTHESRIRDADATWRILYRLDPDAIVIGEPFAKRTRATPQALIRACRRRLTAYVAIQ